MKRLILALGVLVFNFAQANQIKLDSTFGREGEVGVFAGRKLWNPESALDIQADHKILVGGVAGSGAVLTRLSTDGTVDTAFGKNGEVAFDPEHYSVEALSAQKDGMIYVATMRDEGYGHSGIEAYSTYLYRLKEDGSRDKTFSRYGYVVVPPPLGQLYFGANLLVTGDAITVSTGLQIQRFKPNGVVMSKFGSHGLIEPKGYLSFVIDAAGNTIHGAWNTRNRNETDVRRYNPLGQLDSSFGEAGTAKLTWPDEVTNLELKSGTGGRILAVASFSSGRFGVSRLSPNGQLDNSFGEHGFMSSPESSGPGRELFLMPSGNMIVLGSKATALTADGKLDTTFGVSGQFPLMKEGYTLAARLDGNWLYVLSQGDDTALKVQRLILED